MKRQKAAEKYKLVKERLKKVDRVELKVRIKMEPRTLLSSPRKMVTVELKVTVCQELGTNNKNCRYRMNCGSDMRDVDQIKLRIHKGETRRHQLHI